MLTERADSGDAVMVPTLLASGRVKPEAIKGLRARGELDDWLAAAMGEQAEADRALNNYLGR